jgi:hypothetical protein
MYKPLPVCVTAIFLCAGVAFAAGSSSGPTTKSRTLVLNGTATTAGPSDTDPTTGACNFSSWVDQCSGTNCSCYDATSVKVSGSALKGGSVQDFFVTVDNDINPATETVDGGPTPSCNPLLGVVVVSDKNGNSSTVNLMGVTCKHVIGISKNNSTGNHDKDLLSGGWGIDSSDLPSSGWGTFTGTRNHTTNALSLKLSGWITQE